MEETKKTYLSKTLWLNAIAAVSALAFPPVGAWISTHGTEVALILTAVNFGLRLITKERLSLGE